MRVTREILEVLARCRHPVTVITKSALVLRDLDLLADLARDGLAGVGVSITTLDVELKRVMEPQAASPRARLEAVRRLNEAGVPTGVMVAPVIPALTDHEMEAILEAAAAAGARWAGYVLLRLPHEVKDLFREWLAAHYPDRADHVMSVVRQMRGGKDYDSSFRHTHARHRGVRGAAAQPLPDRLPAAGPRDRAAPAAEHGSFPAAQLGPAARARPLARPAGRVLARQEGRRSRDCVQVATRGTDRALPHRARVRVQYSPASETS